MVALAPACLRLGGFLTLVLTGTTTAALYFQPVVERHNRLNWMKKYDIHWKLWALQSRVECCGSFQEKTLGTPPLKM